jgi:two-component system cell cycle sensor histidine kinase/response regulator CckA
MIADAIGDAVVAVDRSGRITYANPAAVQMLDAAVGRELRELAGDGPWTSRELVTRHEALAVIRGAPRIISDTTSPTEDGAVVVIRDVTDHAVARRRAALAAQLADSGMARAAVAHQVNNPLAVILVHAEMLRDELERVIEHLPAQASRIREAMTSYTELERAASAIGALMSDLRTFSQPAVGHGEANAKRAVEYAVRTTSARARDRARIITHVELAEPIAIDEPSLGHILVQLIGNAAAAIEPGAAHMHEICIDVRRENGRALVEVRDTGCGLAANPGAVTFRVTADGVHVGLGLSRARELAAAVGGTVDVVPAPVGAIARVVLPLVRDKARVLVVDADGAYVRGLRRVLRDHEVVACAHRDEALAQLAHDASFDLVLLDVSADLAARELFRRIRADYAELATRVVFTSATVAEPGVADFLASTPNRVLEKPVDAAALRALVTT